MLFNVKIYFEMGIDFEKKIIKYLEINIFINIINNKLVIKIIN